MPSASWSPGFFRCTTFAGTGCLMTNPFQQVLFVIFFPGMWCCIRVTTYVHKRTPKMYKERKCSLLMQHCKFHSLQVNPFWGLQMLVPSVMPPAERLQILNQLTNLQLSRNHFVISYILFRIIPCLPIVWSAMKTESFCNLLHFVQNYSLLPIVWFAMKTCLFPLKFSAHLLSAPICYKMIANSGRCTQLNL
jgi:hypothetical protein